MTTYQEHLTEVLKFARDNRNGGDHVVDLIIDRMNRHDGTRVPSTFHAEVRDGMLRYHRSRMHQNVEALIRNPLQS